MSRCLLCYRPLDDGNDNYHPACAKKFFGQDLPPTLSFTEQDIERMALSSIRSHGVVTGAQPKISLVLHGHNSKKLTIVGLWGTFILKPPSAVYSELPEIEDLTMHLAEDAGITVVPHGLIRMASGNLAYITRRVDRTSEGPLHMEDMCQLTERLTEFKYHGSHEQIAKRIKEFSKNRMLDVINFADVVLFSFIVGNADLHLKNVSLLEQRSGGFAVSPYYDLVATALVLEESEMLALTLHGKKSNIKVKEFTRAFETFGLKPRQIQNAFDRVASAYEPWCDRIENSFVSTQTKERFVQLIRRRLELLELR